MNTLGITVSLAAVVAIIGGVATAVALTIAALIKYLRRH